MTEQEIQSIKSTRGLNPNAGGRRIRLSVQSQTAPAISIVTVVFNGAKALERTILSVLSQGIKNLEYIIVDGGSTDGTVDVIRRYEDRVEYWVSEKDAGISDAFNKGIALSRGEVLGILNAGDVYEPGSLAAVTALAADDKTTDIFYGQVRYCTTNGGAFILSPDHSLLKNKMSLSHPGCFVRLSAYKKYGVFDHAYAIGMDYELMLRFYCGGAKFRPLERLVARMDMEGVSQRKWLPAILEGARAKRKLQGVFNASFYFIIAVSRKLLIDAVEHVGLAPLMDYLRARRAKLRRTKCD